MSGSPLSNSLCRILLVEDEPSHVKLAQRALRNLQHFQLATAGSVQEARRGMRQARPDLILADLQLPDGHGIELLDGVDEAPPWSYSPAMETNKVPYGH